jgi:hypothetical protein
VTVESDPTREIREALRLRASDDLSDALDGEARINGCAREWLSVLLDKNHRDEAERDRLRRAVTLLRDGLAVYGACDDTSDHRCAGWRARTTLAEVDALLAANQEAPIPAKGVDGDPALNRAAVVLALRLGHTMLSVFPPVAGPNTLDIARDVVTAFLTDTPEGE